MSQTTVYAVMYLEINLISVLLVGIIRYKTSGLSKMVSQRNFSHAINAQVVFFLSDTLCVLMKAGMLPWSSAFYFALKTLYFFSTAVMCFFWFVYFELIQGSGFIRTPRNTLISSVLVWVMGVLLIVNTFTGILFYMDSEGGYHRGSLFVLQYLLSYIYVFAASFHALLGIFGRRDLSKRRTLIYLALFPVAPAGAGIVQFIYPELPLACAALSMATLVMYLNWTDEMISLDPLTHLNNRKQLSYYYEQWQEQEDKGPLYLLMIDANKFKSINDTYGHVQGDAALVRIASAMILACSELKEKTNIARFGGDEFTVLIHTDSEEKVRALVGQISAHTERLGIQEKAPYELTVSAGWAKAAPGIGFTELVAAADEELYEEKRRLGQDMR